jgi:hypothetical protein
MYGPITYDAGDEQKDAVAESYKSVAQAVKGPPGMGADSPEVPLRAYNKQKYMWVPNTAVVPPTPDYKTLKPAIDYSFRHGLAIWFAFKSRYFFTVRRDWAYVEQRYAVGHYEIRFRPLRWTWVLDGYVSYWVWRFNQWALCENLVPDSEESNFQDAITDRAIIQDKWRWLVVEGGTWWRPVRYWENVQVGVANAVGIVNAPPPADEPDNPPPTPDPLWNVPMRENTWVPHIFVLNDFFDDELPMVPGPNKFLGTWDIVDLPTDAIIMTDVTVAPWIQNPAYPTYKQITGNNESMPMQIIDETTSPIGGIGPDGNPTPNPNWPVYRDTNTYDTQYLDISVVPWLRNPDFPKYVQVINVSLGVVKITGEVGVPLENEPDTYKTLEIAIDKDEFVADLSIFDINDWFFNKPAGVEVALVTSPAEGGNRITVVFSGTPTTEFADEPIQVLIPAEALVGTTTNIVATGGPDTQWWITTGAPPTPPDPVYPPVTEVVPRPVEQYSADTIPYGPAANIIDTDFPKYILDPTWIDRVQDPDWVSYYDTPAPAPDDPDPPPSPAPEGTDPWTVYLEQTGMGPRRNADVTIGTSVNNYNNDYPLSYGSAYTAMEVTADYRGYIMYWYAYSLQAYTNPFPQIPYVTNGLIVYVAPSVGWRWWKNNTYNIDPSPELPHKYNYAKSEGYWKLHDDPGYVVVNKKISVINDPVNVIPIDIDFNNENIFSFNGSGLGGFSFNVPFCGWGYAITELKIDDFYPSDQSMVQLIEVKNSDLGIRAWRIDSGGGEGYGNWALGSVETRIARVGMDDKQVEEYQEIHTELVQNDGQFWYSTTNDAQVYPEIVGPDGGMTTYSVGADSNNKALIKLKIERKPYMLSASAVNKIVGQNAFTIGLGNQIGKNADVMLDPDTTKIQWVTIHLGQGKDLTLKYDVLAGTFTKTADTMDPWVYVSNAIIVNGKVITGPIVWIINESAPVEFVRTFILAKGGLMAPATIVKQEQKKVTLSNGYGVVDTAAGLLLGPTLVAFNYGDNGITTTTVYVRRDNRFTGTYIPPGIFFSENDNVTYLGYNKQAYELAFEYEGVNYILTVDPNSTEVVQYTVTDIRNGEVKEVLRRSTTDTYTYVKQFWAGTVDVENFWWVDSRHVLELSKYYATLYVKTDELDDWMGDRWVIKERITRGRFVESTDLYYSASCAYGNNQYPVFYRLIGNNQSTSIKIKYVLLDARTPILSIINWREVDVPCITIPFGTELRATAMSSYTEMNVPGIISTARKTATARDGLFILGLRCTHGLAQWTIVINIAGANITKVLHGYGSVGIHGDLTGGQWPSMYCDGNRGFKGPVYDIATLPAALNVGTSSLVLPQKAYGTATQVYFIHNTGINKIVSHYLYKSGVFEPVDLELNNNCVASYDGTSAGYGILYDLIPQAITIGALIGADSSPLGNTIQIFSQIGLPSIYVENPSYSFAHIISHCLCTYAYVWRNSMKDGVVTSPNEPYPKTDSEVHFGNYKREVKLADKSGESAWIDVILKGVTILANEADNYMMNAAQNQTSTDDGGRKSSTFQLDNVMGTIASSIKPSGVKSSLASTISTDFTLDMFYCVNDKTECWAGPGYVNHNLTGQAVVQSVFDQHIDVKKFTYYAVLEKLTNAIISIQKKTEQKLIDQLNAKAASIGAAQVGLPTAMGSGPGAIPVGQVVALALSGTASGLAAHLILMEVLEEKVVPAICLMLGDEKGVSFQSAGLRKDLAQTEAKHTYGDKPMSFFWPAFGVTQQNTYFDESINKSLLVSSQKVQVCGNFSSATIYALYTEADTYSTLPYNRKQSVGGENDVLYRDSAYVGKAENQLSVTKGMLSTLNGSAYLCKYQAIGGSEIRTAPADVAVVEGITTILPQQPFTNEQVSVSPPVFPPSPLMDYCIDKDWDLGVYATYDDETWISQRDTKLIDGQFSNVVIQGTSFCGIASSYIAMEVKNGYHEQYLRPWAVTPNAIALNLNKYNCVHDAKAYHAFDGQGYRVVNYHGGSGLSKAIVYAHYCFQINDHFKRSNVLAPNQWYGFFEGVPAIAIESTDTVVNFVTDFFKQPNAPATKGEDKDVLRFSLPIFSEEISTLPAMVRTLGPYALTKPDGVTSVVTQLRNTMTTYKAPTSKDFNINGTAYRATNEYIGPLNVSHGLISLDPQVAIAGLTFIGATTTEAFFYSPATRMYYSFGGGRSITKKDILNRFVDLTDGKWDFVNQEVVFKCLLGEETLVCRLDGGKIIGEVYPPNDTVCNKRSGFKLLSMPGGLVYQGPERFAVNRFVINEHMIAELRKNKRKWKRVSREQYEPERNYGWKYENVLSRAPIGSVFGWTHNPFRLVTAMLGGSEETDNRYEWSLTFAWTPIMEAVFDAGEYVTVDVQAETVTPGGTLLSSVTHIYLYKELFLRQGIAGYYTFKFQSNNGVGNRERLMMWSDGIIAVESIQLASKTLTSNRTQILVTQADIQDFQEL